MREWILKGLGGLILLAASVGYGQARIAEEKRRRGELEALIALVSVIRGEIGALSRPLSDIWASFSSPALEKNGFLPALRRDGFVRALAAADWRLTEDERAPLLPFAASLGKTYREEQVALCRRTEEKLGAVLSALEKNGAEREKLWRTLPPLAALSAILLFL